MRRALVVLCLFSGLTCIWGGLELVIKPDGSLVGLPVSLLRYSPFENFLLPGLLLGVVVGGACLVAGVLQLAPRKSVANGASMVAGVVLATWITVEMALLRTFHWLHGVYLALAIAITVLALVSEWRAGVLDATLRSLGRVTAHAVLGWGLCAAVMGALLARYNATTALFVHGLASPAIFLGVSAGYFGRSGVRSRVWAPLRTALAFTAIVALLDLIVVACFVERSLAMFRSPLVSWMPLALIFSATWATGLASSGVRRQELAPRH